MRKQPTTPGYALLLTLLAILVGGVAELMPTILVKQAVPASGAAQKPYTALEPKQSLYEVNQQIGAITGPHAAERRRAALASARMNFHEPDAAPSERLNRILWHDARGWDVPYPALKRSLFFPMAVDLTDDEREERAARERARKP